jgi:excisionase family DNA binding protein
MSKSTPEQTENDLRFMTLEEIAKILRVPPDYVKKAYYRNELQGLKIGTQLRFTRKEVDRWIIAGLKKSPSRKLSPSDKRLAKKGPRRSPASSPLPSPAVS